MGMGNGYLDKLEANKQDMLIKMQAVTRQFMMDTLDITLHEDFGFGYDKIKAVNDKWGETYAAYFGALTVDQEADVCQEKMDRAMQDIIKGKGPFYSFRERYPEVRQLGYARRRK